jgi:lactose/L-arabinose transport system substrate-binding protein
MKKSISTLLLILILITTFNGCSGTKDSNDTNKITIWAWNVNVGALEDAAKEYNKNTTLEVDVQDIGRLDVYDKLSTGLQAGGTGLPDAVLIEDDRFQGYLEAFPDGFKNLSKSGFDEFEENFPTFKKDVVSKDGEFYGFPFDAGPAGVFYRRDIFEEAGVNAEDISTWNDFYEAGIKIKEKTNTYIFPVDKHNDDGNYRIIMNQLGVYYFDKNGNIDFMNENSINAMEIYKKFNDANLIKDVNGWDGTVSATKDGSVASIPSGAWYYGTIIDQAEETNGKWGVFLMPSIEEGGNKACNLGGSSWAIPSSSKNADEAYKFMEYFTTTKDIQIMAMKDYGLFPSLNETYSDDLFKEENEFFGGQKIWELFSNEMNDIPTAYYTSDYSKALDEAVKVQSEVTNGEDVKKSLNEAATRLKNTTGRDVN